MTPKHTSGPWTTQYNPDTECWEVNEPYDGLHCPTIFEGSQSDARLIAAAPDLLHACEAALAAINDKFNAPYIADIQKMLSQAIAKAQGE